MTSTVTVPTWTPPRWLNAMMMTMLRTPVLQNILGRGIALITVTGRKSGRLYTTPVSYYREGDTVTVLSKRFRAWWRNFDERPDVELRLAGQLVHGRARASVGDESELPMLARFLEQRRADAKAYGVGFTPDGQIHREQLRSLLSQIVVIRIALNDS
jgi:deazaflavin-dependent oxidoreductase (nitroreductase family)